MQLADGTGELLLCQCAASAHLLLEVADRDTVLVPLLLCVREILAQLISGIQKPCRRRVASRRLCTRAWFRRRGRHMLTGTSR